MGAGYAVRYWDDSGWSLMTFEFKDSKKKKRPAGISLKVSTFKICWNFHISEDFQGKKKLKHIKYST